MAGGLTPTSATSSAAPTVAQTQRIVVDLISPSSPTSWPTVLAGGSTLEILIAGQRESAARAELVYERTVVRREGLRLDARGGGWAAFDVPEVGVRTLCSLVVSDKSRAVSRPAVVYPRRTAGNWGAELQGLSVGIVDGNGVTSGVLRDGVVPFEDLGKGLSLDYFLGELAIVAGLTTREAADRVCARFDDRLAQGMTLVVVNPPPGWSRWGLSRLEIDSQYHCPVSFTEGFGASLTSGDLFLPEVKAKMGASGTHHVLMSVRSVGASKPHGGSPGNGGDAIIVAVSVGKGTAIVAMTGLLGQAGDQPIGAYLLDDILHWAIAEKVKQRKGRRCGRESY
jgi:hypothetical protein